MDARVPDQGGEIGAIWGWGADRRAAGEDRLKPAIESDREWDPSTPLIVIGGSAGGLATLRRLTSALPPAFPAPILVALHATPGPETLPYVMRRAGPLPAMIATDGQALAAGRVVLAPPGFHLLVEHGRVRLGREEEEHHFRPAIDPLFRTAARVYGPRVIGVLLSGRNADGTAGLLNVVMHGGAAIVQDPDETEHPTMPRSALANVADARRLPAAKIAPLLVRLATQRHDVTALPAVWRATDGLALGADAAVPAD